MVDGQLIAKNDFFIFIYVDESWQPGKRQAKIVEKSGILAEMVCVIGIVHAWLIVTQK